MDNNKTLTAWEKMQLDMIYDDFDEDLFNRRVEAKNIFNKFNITPSAPLLYSVVWTMEPVPVAQ